MRRCCLRRVMPGSASSSRSSPPRSRSPTPRARSLRRPGAPTAPRVPSRSGAAASWGTSSVRLAADGVGAECLGRAPGPRGGGGRDGPRSLRPRRSSMGRRRRDEPLRHRPGNRSGSPRRVVAPRVRTATRPRDPRGTAGAGRAGSRSRAARDRGRRGGDPAARHPRREPDLVPDVRGARGTRPGRRTEELLEELADPRVASLVAGSTVAPSASRRPPPSSTRACTRVSRARRTPASSATQQPCPRCAA